MKTKTIKTLMTFMLTALLALSLAACGGSDDADAHALKYVKGTIADASMNTLSIDANDGKSYTFSTADADMSSAAGLETGSDVEVYYTGTITGTDTSKSTVVRVVQSGGGAPDPTPAVSTPPADDGTEHTVTGTILDSDGATLVVRPDDGGDALTFVVAGADSTGANGLVIGDEVTVYYTGALGGDVTVTRVTQDPANTPNADAGNPDTEKSISGTITYSDGATLSLTTADGTEYTFLVAGADANGANGLVEGDEVTITYTGVINGTDTSGVTVQRLEQ